MDDDVTELAQSERGRRHSSEFVVTVETALDAGKSLHVSPSAPGRLYVGQSEICALRLGDPRVSRRHLSLEIASDALRVCDLESTNGSLVNGIRFREVRLEGGEHLSIGATVLRVERVATTPVARRGESEPSSFGRLLGASDAMRRLYPLCERLAQTDVPALLEGPTGTGKEQLAEAIHERGPRHGRPFVVFDCTAVTPSLIEAELFGSERGAYTGSVGSRPGVFEQANGGTLLIDEIGDLELSLQPKLLRVIERREVKRVGGARPIPVDVRILTATRRDLDRQVGLGAFRDDLFHRIAVARLELPPLRERTGDVALLARAFASKLGSQGSLPYELVAGWETYSWPGNVRELRNAVVRYLALGDQSFATNHPPNHQDEADASSEVFREAATLALPVARQRVIDAFERFYVAALLDRYGGDLPTAIEASGLAARQFYRIKAKTRKVTQG